MASRTHPFLPPHPSVVVEAEERVWDGRFPLDVVRFRHRRFDGALSEPRTWELWRRGRAMALLPYDPWRDVVVLMEQFRLPALAAGIEPVMVEIPAGFTEPGESDADALRRETREETGLAPDLIEPIGDFMLTPGGCDELIGIQVGRVRLDDDAAVGADGVIGHGGLTSEHEDIRVRAWPAARATEAALDGALPNSVASLALMWLAARREGLRARWRAA
jgi:ADP-ribose pyrophosphatase